MGCNVGLVLIGLVLTLTGIGAIIGIPMIILGCLGVGLNSATNDINKLTEWLNKKTAEQKEKNKDRPPLEDVIAEIKAKNAVKNKENIDRANAELIKSFGDFKSTFSKPWMRNFLIIAVILFFIAIFL